MFISKNTSKMQTVSGTCCFYSDKSPKSIKKKINPVIVDAVVDFVRMYADRTHHGKEEEILFRDLIKKDMTPELKKIMQELLDEHVWGRKTTAALVAAKEKYLSGDEKAFAQILDLARQLSDFYPRHIEKEDKHFFYPAQE